MATPLGHSIVGYTVARLAGVNSRQGLMLSVAAASLPDIDFLLGLVANGDPRSLHREAITHTGVFPLLVGAATGIAAVGWALLRGRRPSAREVLRPAALATALVGSHVIMDPLPLPYDSTESEWGTARQIVAGQAWNAVIDLAVYGGLAMAILGENNGNGRPADAWLKQSPS